MSNEARQRSNITPLVLSAGVCPGAGQFVQRRWLAGILFSVPFAAGVVGFSVVVASFFYRAWSALLASGGDPAAMPGFPYADAARWLGFCGLVYAVSLVDVVAAGRRKQS